MTGDDLFIDIQRAESRDSKLYINGKTSPLSFDIQQTKNFKRFKRIAVLEIAAASRSFEKEKYEHAVFRSAL